LNQNYYRGECLVELKDLNRGLEEYLTCLSINPLIKEANIRVSIIYYKLAIVCFNNKEYMVNKFKQFFLII